MESLKVRNNDACLPDMMHAQEKVKFIEEAYIDIELVPAIKLLNKKGYKTMNSCMGGWLDDNDGYKTGAKNKNENKDGMRVKNEVGSDYIPLYCTFAYPYQQLIKSTLPKGFKWEVFNSENMVIETAGMMGIFLDDEEMALEYGDKRCDVFYDWVKSLPVFNVLEV